MGRIGQRVEFVVVETRETKKDGRVAVIATSDDITIALGDHNNGVPLRCTLDVPDDMTLPERGTKVVFVGGVALDGCLAKVAPDEPIFVLRAQDETAADTVRLWASHLLEMVKDEQPRDADNMPGTPAMVRWSALMRKVHEALDLAAEMERWPTRKRPD